MINTNQFDSQSSTNGCDHYNQTNCGNQEAKDAAQDITKHQKNLNNYSTMSSQKESEKELILENAAAANGSKVDKDEKELMKASQEINRSNRKLIKQTFNSNVLEIESASGSSEKKKDEKAVKDDEDDWDSL